jgi:ribosomal protein S18 acetylase RimI-like enzyme
MLPTFALTVITHDDLPAVAAIHTGAFPDSALTALGVEAVRRYYAWQLSGPHEMFALGVDAVQYDNDGKIVNEQLIGYCFVGVFRGALSGFVGANRAYLARRVLMRPWLLANPLFRERLALGLRALSSPLRPVTAANTLEVAAAYSVSTRIQDETNKSRSFGILSIAVTNVFQSMGAGALLMAKIEAIARQAGFESMDLTVHPSNTRGVRFYERLGWHKDIGKVNEGIWQGRMHKVLMETA